MPLDDASVDVAMSIYSDFHWSDRARGIEEMLRVSRRSIVLLTVDRVAADGYWLTRDYFPDGNAMFAPLDAVVALFPSVPEIRAVPIPHDCSDGFVQAFWKRPLELLDPDVRATMALFARLPAASVEDGIEQLRTDLDTGEWKRRNRELAELDSLDLGHRLIIWEHPLFPPSA